MFRILLFILFFFITLLGQSQDLDLSKIKVVESDVSINYLPMNNFGNTNITKSQNQIEIRIYKSAFLGSKLVILSYNDSEWNGQFFKTTTEDFDTLIFKKEYKFSNLLETLIKGEIFSLPSFDKLKLETHIYDASKYRVYYKVNNKFGMYYFDSPKSYLEDYPNNETLKKYDNVLTIIESLFNTELKENYKK